MNLENLIDRKSKSNKTKKQGVFERIRQLRIMENDPVNFLKNKNSNSITKRIKTLSV